MNNRFASTLAAGALCALALVAAPAQAAVSPSATDAGGWLADQLTNGLIHNDQYGFDDYGLTLDVLFALQAADTQGARQDAIVSAVRDNVGNYITSAFDAPEARYAGASAKLLVAVQAAEKDPTAFGGFDLVDTVEKSVTDSGRVADRGSSYGDYANMLGQSFALQGLAEAKSAEVAPVRDFLLGQQCPDGYFPLVFDVCKEDTDATANAIRAMSAAKADGVTGLDAALTKATDWLLGRQADDGSFIGGESTPDANANSTGIAASVLATRGKTLAAEKAAAWVYRLQVKASTGGKLGSERGAVAYVKDSFDAGIANGITDDTADQWRRATAQAALGLIHLDPATIDTKVVEKVVTKVPKPLVRTVTKSAAVVVNDPVPVADKADSPQGRLGQYLAGKLSNGDHIEVKDGDETFTDYDLTADAVLGLRQLGQQPSFAARAGAFLLARPSVDAYAHGAPYEKDAAYADALAKLVIVGTLTKDVPARDLRALASELADLQQDDGTFADKGKYADRSGDTRRHVLATLALLMAGDEAAGGAVEALAGSQCEDGLFPASLGADCETGDPVATGWALQALNATSKADRPAGKTLAELPDGWDEDRVATVVDAATALGGVVRVDGTVVGADVGSLAAIASGRQAAGLDVRATALHLARLQKGDGGLPSIAGDKKSNVNATIAAAPALAPASLLSTPGTGLTSAVSLPLAATVDEPAGLPAPAADSDDLTITRPVAYAGGGVLGLLLLAALGWGIAGRRGGSA